MGSRYHVHRAWLFDGVSYLKKEIEQEIARLGQKMRSGVFGGPVGHVLQGVASCLQGQHHHECFTAPVDDSFTDRVHCSARA
jgi:hypothetical protein